MTDTLLPHDPSTFALWREAQDLSRRTRLGGVYYLLAWLLTWLLCGEPLEYAGLGLGIGLLFGALMLLRSTHRLPARQNEANMRRWIGQNWTLILLTTLAWGLTHALVLQDPSFAGTRLVATTCTIAFSTAFAFTFAMQLWRGMLAVLLLNVPGLLVLASQGQAQLSIFLTLLIYQGYLLVICRRTHREYHASIALELQLLEQRNALEALSRTDSLTQLGNRYQFNNLFPAMVAHAQRQNSPLALVLLDIDHFKRINDEFGHSAGDACLQEFAARMRRVFRRDSDALLRLGGEEFGVLMPDTTLEQARQLAEQFRQAIASEQIAIQSQTLALTTSAGVGCFDARHDPTAEAFFRRVDAALYQAKEQGRDRLILA